MYKVLPSMWYF